MKYEFGCKNSISNLVDKVDISSTKRILETQWDGWELFQPATLLKWGQIHDEWNTSTKWRRKQGCVLKHVWRPMFEAREWIFWKRTWQSGTATYAIKTCKYFCMEINVLIGGMWSNVNARNKTDTTRIPLRKFGKNLCIPDTSRIRLDEEWLEYTPSFCRSWSFLKVCARFALRSGSFRWHLFRLRFSPLYQYQSLVNSRYLLRCSQRFSCNPAHKKQEFVTK